MSYNQKQKNIYISFLLMLVSFFIILFVFHLKIPNYYTNKELAFELLNNSNNISLDEVNSMYKNPYYIIQNIIFHVFAFSLVNVIISLFLYIQIKGKCFFKMLLENKIVIYILWNLLYPIWMNLFIKVFIIDLDKYVYPVTADTLAIPEIMLYGILLLFGYIYYPVANILNILVYNTKLVNNFLINIYRMMFVVLIIFVLLNLSVLFSWDYILLYFIYYFYGLLILSSIRYLKNKNID